MDTWPAFLHTLVVFPVVFLLLRIVILAPVFATLLSLPTLRTPNVVRVLL